MEHSNTRRWDSHRSRIANDTPRLSYALNREGSTDIDSPSTSIAPTPEPRLPQQSSNDMAGYHGSNILEPVIPSHNREHLSPFLDGADISRLGLNSRPSSSFPPSQSCRHLIPTSSSASQSDDEDGDETDHQDFADKNFQIATSHPNNLHRRRGGGGGGIPTKLRTRSAGVIPDEALDWLNNNSALSENGKKGKESAEIVGTTPFRRRTITRGDGGTNGSSNEKQEVLETVVQGLASTMPQEIILHVSSNSSTTPIITTADEFVLF